MSAAPEVGGAPQDRRAGEREAYLATTEWRRAEVVPLGSDASIRQYFRLVGGPVPALLMDAPSAARSAPCPPAADEEERRRLGYPAMVRGSGSSILAYGAVSRLLAERGIVAPAVLDARVDAGFAIVEDLGPVPVAHAVGSRAEELRLYHLAADVLERLRAVKAVPGEVSGWPLQTYDMLAYEAEAALLAEWYLPRELGLPLTDSGAQDLSDAWRVVLGRLSAPDRLVHRDFHAENLVVCGDGIGVLDFQDMMVGQAAYDWVSLLEDARRDVDPGVRAEIMARGRDNAPDPEGFERDCAILAAQRNAKILGLFARLAHRDGKPRYRALMPRVRALFAEDLRREPLRPVAEVLGRIAPGFPA